MSNNVEMRRWAYDQALANSLQEGFEPSPEFMEIHEKTIQGEMTTAQALAYFLPNQEPGAKLLVYSGDDGFWYWFIQGAEGEKIVSGGGFKDEATARGAGAPVFAEYCAREAL